jgi:sulfate/thiosulfate transport system permease protein
LTRPGAPAPVANRRRVGEGPVLRAVLILLALTGTTLLLLVPLGVIFFEALRAGFGHYVASIIDPETVHAVLLTVLTALVVVPINLLFGIAAAWAISRFSFPGKKLLLTTIELPFSVSPVVAGVTYLFLYGAQGLLGPLLGALDVQVMFTVPAIFLVSLFVTCPYVARSLIPLMQAQGADEEEAAISLGASGFIMFVRVTLPNIKWALMYGVILCNARVMGEFGAVSVVSGNIRGQTNTLPLQIELLFNDQNVAGAFAAASSLAVLALVTLIARVAVERLATGQRQAPRKAAPVGVQP